MLGIDNPQAMEVCFSKNGRQCILLVVIDEEDSPELFEANLSGFFECSVCVSSGILPERKI